MWTPTTDDSLWFNWSRASRTPSIGEVAATAVLGVQPLPPTSPFPALVLRSQPAPYFKPKAERANLKKGEPGKAAKERAAKREAREAAANAPAEGAAE